MLDATSEDLSNYFSQKNEINDLKKRLAYQVAQKHKAFKSRDKMTKEKDSIVNILCKLFVNGKLDMTIDDIAKECFRSKRGIVSAIKRVKAV